MAKWIDTADVAKLVRKALAAQFPDTKFRVRTSRYSMGSSVSVSWVDGPTTQQVEAQVSHFGGASFDGSIDLKSYHDSILDGERVRFGADWITCQREFSVGFAQRAVNSICRRRGIETFQVADRRGTPDWSDAWKVRFDDGMTLQDLIYRELSRRAAVKAQLVAC
jgi:hypothetical protein